MGMQNLYEKLRWDLNIESDTEEEFVLNNDFASFYARLIMQKEADLCDAFNVRSSIADTMPQLSA